MKATMKPLSESGLNKEEEKTFMKQATGGKTMISRSPTDSEMRPKIRKDILKDNLELYSLMIPVLILIFIFCYIPMYGIVIAFQNYIPGSSFIGHGVDWVGLKHFIHFVQGEYFFQGRIRNDSAVERCGMAMGLSHGFCSIDLQPDGIF